MHPKGNPHYNLDPLSGKIIARNIADGLSRNYPQHKATFEKNLSAYLAELDKAITRWQGMAAPLKGVKIVTYHVEWSYFANRFGLQQVGMIELKPGIEPTPNHLVALAQKMQQEKAQLIIYGAQSDRFPAPVGEPNRRERRAIAKHRRRVGGNRYLHQVYRLQLAEFARSA